MEGPYAREVNKPGMFPIVLLVSALTVLTEGLAAFDDEQAARRPDVIMLRTRLVTRHLLPVRLVGTARLLGCRRLWNQFARHSRAMWICLL